MSSVKPKVIGSGKHISPIMLKKSLLFAFVNKPITVERELKYAHGTALRLCRKVRSFGLTLEELTQMSAKEISKLYYSRSPRKKKSSEATNSEKEVSQA